MTTQASPIEHAPPKPDRDSAGYWAALAEEQVAAQHCRACGTQFLPPMPGCPFCGEDRSELIEIPGTGTIYSHVTVHVALHPADADRVPYSILTVDLDGGGRAFGCLDGPAEPRIGARVSPRFVDHGTWSELRFAVEDES